MFTLPGLPFDPGAFGTFTSKETFEYHHGKHHAGYVKKLNAAIEGTPYIDTSIEDVIASARRDNNAAILTTRHSTSTTRSLAMPLARGWRAVGRAQNCQEESVVIDGGL